MDIMTAHYLITLLELLEAGGKIEDWIVTKDDAILVEIRDSNKELKNIKFH